MNISIVSFYFIIEHLSIYFFVKVKMDLVDPVGFLKYTLLSIIHDPWQIRGKHSITFTV